MFLVDGSSGGPGIFVMKSHCAITLYHNVRHLNPRLMDKSSKKIGTKCLYNWAGTALEKLNFKWYDEDLTNDGIRTRLKKSFYPPSYWN